MSKPKGSWQFWIDRGGTFTDVLALSPSGDLHIEKLLSENPAHYPDATLHAINKIISSNGNQDISCIKLGTTLGTNALLERKGAPVLLVTTKGFRDQVLIGYQNRPQIFARKIVRPAMIYKDVLEVEERIDATGHILSPLNLSQAKADLSAAFNTGLRACAITLMHGYRYPDHEKLLADLAKEIGFEQVSVSHEVSPLIKYVSRADTTLLDAYLSPKLKKYIGTLKNSLPETPLFFMQSNGGLAESSLFRGKDSVLSGPSGGIIAAVKTAAACGFNQIISFDMGGTSTDVSHYNGELEYSYDTEVSGLHIRTPMLDIHTVAAGGGSILHFDGSALKVGPASAGAKPGPLCYGNGGPLTITDANLLLGKIQTGIFPSIFGPSGNEPADEPAVNQAFAKLAESVAASTGNTLSREELAEGFIEIAVTKMANAIRHVSVQRGHDLNDYTLCSFGGAGGQHACLIAEALGIKKVLIHPYAGLLSAYGIGIADSSKMQVFDVNEGLDSVDSSALGQKIKEHIRTCRHSLSEEEGALETMESEIRALLRYQGSDFSLSIPYGTKTAMKEAFAQRHLSRYGFISEDKTLILDSISIKLFWQPVATTKINTKQHTHKTNLPPNKTKFFSRGMWHECQIIPRHSLKAGDCLSEPVLIAEENATTVVEPGWKVDVLADHSLLLSPKNNNSPLPQTNSPFELTVKDPGKLEFFSNLFMFIAEQMGITLQNTSYSVNIKERLDFSCAIFDKEGQLVANAPHIPVHLGSMGDSVQTLIRDYQGKLRPGDSFASNNPFNGGTHLPDITVISPVFDATNIEPLFYVASRGHHADIGGITPGSMPADSRSIEEEGVILDNFQLTKNNVLQEAELMALLSSSPYPARNPAQNLADLKAQLAANAHGASELLKAVEKWSKNCIQTYMGLVLDHAETCVRQAISKLKSGDFSCEMDDGVRIKVTITIDHGNNSASIDFSGSSAQQENNLNAPRSICKAAVLYAFRTLVDEDIPLNAGCFRPLSLIVPDKSVLNPTHPAAVVAGNVETSQVIVDVLFGALGEMAASQGTMNNLTFGNEKHQYYETICGGTGAGKDFDGVDAIHSHMTNSRLTDPEVLETRFPVLVDSFAVRLNSYGQGIHRGGNGATRQIRFLEPMTAVILSNRRRICPHGLAGGLPGAPGRNLIVRKNGDVLNLGGRASLQVEPGDLIIIESPGGGGFGSPKNYL